METRRADFESGLGFYPFGVQYHRAPTPLPEEWAGDLAEIAAAGYTHIQLRPQWRWHERVRGNPRWDDLDELFELAGRNRLRVVLKPMLETAPDWVFDELGGTRVGFHGAPISPCAHAAFYVGGWLPCFDNPEVALAAGAFTRQLVARYRRHPALWMYDAWNEPRSRPLSQCQCAHSQRSYREWLRRRFGSVEAMNAALGKAWTSFESVRPPSSASDHVEMLLWRQWAAFSVSEQVRFAAEAIRAEDPDGFILVHVGGSSVVQDPACDTSDDLLNARSCDRYGTSVPIFHHPRKPTEHSFLDYQFDWMRRVDPLYWCHEFYPNTAQWARPPSPRALRSQIWASIGGGAAAFTFWQYRSERFGEESNGYGLRNIDGTPTPRSQVADGIADTLRRHGNSLVGTRRVPAKVRLLHSRESDLCLRLQQIHRPSEDIQNERGNIDYPYKQALRAAHFLHQAAGADTEFVTPGDPLDGVALLHVTAAEIVDAPTAEWLRGYARDGGTLLVEFPFACRDQRGWVEPQRPAHGLEDLLGCREADRVVAAPEQDESATLTAWDKVVVRPSGWRVELAPLSGAEVVATWENGAAAALRHRYGKGLVYAFGVNLSLAFQERWDDPLIGVFERLLGDCGLPRPPWTSRELWVRRRRGEGREIWFVQNMGDGVQETALPHAPRKILEGDGCEYRDGKLRLEGGAVWVAEMPTIG